MFQTKKHPLIWGTFILTAAGLLSRLIGFFYRIYLSRLFGEEGMGIYQLFGPVLSLCFSLCAAGYQTAISKAVAERSAKSKKKDWGPLITGLSISFPLSLLCTIILYYFAEPIGTVFMKEPRCVPLLKILAFTVPFSAIHSCINGYFYGLKKTVIPSFSQLFEQITRIFCVYLFTAPSLQTGLTPSLSSAMWGLVIGEFSGVVISLFAVFSDCKKNIFQNTLPCYEAILKMALPLTANRIILNLLQSTEAVSLPEMLRKYGYDTKTSLAVFGVLTGMALPMIFFPNALTGSVSVMLLPYISEEAALGKTQTVKKSILRAIKYCGFLGLCSLLFFFTFGNLLGSFLFHSTLSGHFIKTLGFICPFLYLNTTLSGILQGLGMAGKLFILNTSCLLLRLLFVLITVPVFGIYGYFLGLIISQTMLCTLSLLSLKNFLILPNSP